MKTQTREVKTIKRRAGIKSFRDLGLYDKPKRKKKPTVAGTLRGSIGLGFGQDGNMKITRKQAKRVGEGLGIDWSKYSLAEFTSGMNIEREHDNLTKGNLHQTGMIAQAHLDERSDYYVKLRKYVEQ